MLVRDGDVDDDDNNKNEYLWLPYLEPDLGAGGQRCIGFEVSSRQLPLFNIKGHIF